MRLSWCGILWTLVCLGATPIWAAPRVVPQQPGNSHAEETLPFAPPPLDGQALIEANVDLAWDYANGGGVNRALTLLKGWEQEWPQVTEYPFTRGALLYQEERHAEALEAFSRALDIGATDQSGLWARLYATDILLIRNLTARAARLLDEALTLPGTPESFVFATNLRQRIRIREELHEVNEIGGITYYLPDYLIPVQERPAAYRRIETAWEQAVDFLGLAPETPAPTLYLYPSERLYQKYFPLGVDLHQQSYAHREVHVIYPGERDVLPDLAPYALYQLQKQINRDGQGFWLLAPSLDEAIRGATADGVGLAAVVRGAKEAGKLPLIESLLDPRNQGRLPAEIAEPTMGLLLRFLKERFPEADFRSALTQPAFLGALPRPLASYQQDFERYVTEHADLLEDPRLLAAAIEAIPPFLPLPVIDPTLQVQLRAASTLFDEGKRDEARVILEALLAREPRYGEARYLLAKDLYDRNRLQESAREFERVLGDTAPGTLAVGFSHFYLGRIAKLHRHYELALAHYQAALANGLPQQRRWEAEGYAATLERYLRFAPSAGEATTVDPSPFFQGFDAHLNGQAGFETLSLMSPQADPLRGMALMELFEDSIDDPLPAGTQWRHTVLGVGQVSYALVNVEVRIERLTAEGTLLPSFRPVIRRFQMQLSPLGAQIVDFADESAIFRPAGRLSGAGA